MGAFQGGLTYRQYFVRDALPSDWKELFQQGITKEAFKPIQVSSEEDRAVGWCSPKFPLDIDLDDSMYRYNEYIVLSMRVDTLTVPGPLLRIHTEQRSREVMADQGRENLSRYERAELKELVKMELRKKMMPSIKTVDMVWNWTEGMVRFFASSEKANLEFMELFENTFGLQLTPDAAWTSAQEFKLTDDEKAALEAIEPTPFVDLDTAVAAMKA